MPAGFRLRTAAVCTLFLLLAPLAARAQVNVVFIWHQPDMQTFYLADFFDMAQESVDTSQQPDLFTFQLINTLGIDQLVSLRLTLRVEGLDIDELGWVQTNLFTLEPAGLTINNREFSAEGQPWTIDGDKSGYDEDVAEDLTDTILQTGLLPSDTYTFKLEVYDQYDQPIPGGSSSYSLIVSNPSRVDLVAPGAEFGSTLPVVATATPQFFWSTDAAATGLTQRYTIRVVKVEDSASAEEVMQGYANWEAVIEDKTTEIYPSAVNAIALDPGATYAWQVIRHVTTSGGTIDLESEIFWFKLEDQSGGVIGATVDEQVNQMVNQIQDIQGVGSQMEGYEPTGQVFIDGQPVDINTLKDLLEQILNGVVQISSIIIR